ncbi:PREDICTED: cytochrome c oxidase assembly factor 4 homolog, mitochondrial-like [Priapulus caudatus]|uniref:Cytochrome c oxidase assembly factor 4 homolog, mitochondrial-like n=1 Tax=Priapulus caudatus TaxID=37621 RepID=A0ABM1ED41_PRICU|nr:PREDICTED: cytochrome c oxidase assembly factor 4 homolog, mitochondrial-like [Priapulus caudatus]
MDAHNRKGSPTVSAEDIDDEEDPVETMMKKTGCMELHYAVQDCMIEHRDWRKCQDKVAEFKNCISNYHKRMSAD